ncbi:MAG: hypothetical protein EBU96_09595, partial [Actinobacteria bacterium]|nr:hypothetical protein [Actinomycetota bacterium]
MAINPILDLSQARTNANAPKASAQTLANQLGSPVSDGSSIKYPKNYSANKYNTVNDYLQSQINAENAKLGQLKAQLSTLHGQMKKAPLNIFNNFQGGYTGTKAQMAQEAALQKQIAAIGGSATGSQTIGGMSIGPSTTYTGTLGTLLKQQADVNSAIAKTEKTDLSTLASAQKSELTLLRRELEQQVLDANADLNPLQASRTEKQNAIAQNQTTLDQLKKVKSPTADQKAQITSLTNQIKADKTAVTNLDAQIKSTVALGGYKTLLPQIDSLSGEIDKYKAQLDGTSPTTLSEKELKAKVKELTTQQSSMMKQLNTYKTDALAAHQDNFSVTVTGEKNANTAELNSAKNQLAAKGFQDLRLAHNRPLTAEEMADMPWAKEKGITSDVINKFIADGFEPPKIPTGYIYSEINSPALKGTELANTVNAQVMDGLKFLDKYNLTQRYKTGDTTVGFTLDSAYELSKAREDQSISPVERQMIGKVMDKFYRKAEDFLDRDDLSAEEIPYKLSLVPGSPNVYSAKLTKSDTGGHTAYFTKNSDGTYAFSGGTWTYTKPDDGGFFGSGIGRLLVSVAAAYLAPGIGNALVGSITKAAVTAGTISATTAAAINAAVGGAIVGGIKSGIAGGDVLTGAFTGGISAGLGKYIGPELEKFQFVKDMPPAIKAAFIDGVSSAATKFATTGDLGEAVKYGLTEAAGAGAATYIQEWLKNSELLKKWDAKDLDKKIESGEVNGFKL